MMWVYYCQNGEELKNGENSIVELVYLRPVWIEDNQEYTSGVIEIRIVAVDFIEKLTENNEFSKDETQFLIPIGEKVKEKGYYIDERPPEDDEKKHFLNKADIYVPESFGLTTLLHWIKLYLMIQGYPITGFKETDYDKFANDINFILRVFSIDNAKKFEPDFGPEWWKTTHQKEPDKNAIESLLKQINQN